MPQVGVHDLAVDYMERRERTERAAAKRAASVMARRVHQELAQRYRAMIISVQSHTDRRARAPADEPRTGAASTPDRASVSLEELWERHVHRPSPTPPRNVDLPGS